MKAEMLHSRQNALADELRENEAAGETLALQAAFGDEPAKRGFAKLFARRQEISAQIAALDSAIRTADAEELAAVAVAEAGRRSAAILFLSDLLAERLSAAGAIEADLKALLRKIGAYAALSNEIETRHAALNARPLERNLSPEAIGGRLAEFMAGLGFDAFLPLSRPEMRPVIRSLALAEAAAQESYRIVEIETGEVPA